MNQQPTNIGFEKTKKACNDKQSGAYLIARDVYENDGKKQFARIDDFPEFSSYIQTLPLEERCFYECIEENKPVKWHLDFDCKTALPEDVKQINIDMIIDNIVHAFEPYEVTKDDIVILNSSSDTKTSFHFILNKIHFQNIKSLKFLKDNVFKSLFDTVDFLDGVIYGVRCFRMPMCTKYGKDRHLNIVSNHSFLDALITYIPENSILLEMKEDIKKTVVQPIKLLPNNEQCGLEQCFIKNVSLFSEYSSDYSKWVSVGIKLYRANCNVETFKLFSKLSPKYNEHICEKKWDSFQHYDKNSNSLINFMTFVGIKVNIGDNDIFEDCIFNKKHLCDDMLIYPPLGRPYVDPLYIDFVIKYINRFFCIIALTKTEYFRIEYNEYNKPCKLTHRYSKQSLLDANENIKPFMQDWLVHSDRREYINVEFEPDMNVPLRFDTFNLYFGLKIEMMYNITSYDYNIEMVNPFISHITDVFCKGNQQHGDYLLNWIANIVQKPSEPNMVAVVIKSEKQGVGKGLIFDTLLGHGIFGHETYLQVNNVDGLLGHFNSELMNKLLINVNEVSMTKAQANEIKSMITDPFMQAEAKFLNKLKVRNCSNFVMTSNNDYCVCIDEGFNDRRYFILDADCSRANDQEYYSQFVQYCKDPLVHLEVYKFLKSKDLSTYNPRIILETEEKAKYRMKAIPLPIQFIQYYIEEYQSPGHPINNTWEYKHEFRYEDLYQVFIEYKQRFGVLKPIPLNTFRDCISKRLKPEVGRRTREGGSKIRYYTFGNNPQQVVEYLKQNGLYNENL